MYRSSLGFQQLVLLAVAFALVAGTQAAVASPVSQAVRERLARGAPTWVIVEVDAAAADRAATAERARRGLGYDDKSVLDRRSRGYAATKSAVEAAAAGADAARALDYSHFALSVWRLSSLAALDRLLSLPSVRMVHENILLRPVSVSDLSFINQPQAAAEGATGAGTTIAVIDGGLDSNYLHYSDFGTCTAVNTPPSTCRVVYNYDFYPAPWLAANVTHGTNVSAIALGVAPGAKLAMYNVFNGSSASAADILSAMNSAISNQATYDIVAINMSLSDGSSNASPCSSSVFESAVTSASNAGITTVAAAGNSGSKSGLGDPACAPGVVSVGAVYDNYYGTVGWQASAASGGTCSDASAPGLVTCFSQSASYLALLAPGTFVNAPDSSFQESGTSQATPHVAGSVAVLRARYPAESLGETLQRMTLSGTPDKDPGNGQTVPRLNLLAAVNQGTALTLQGTGSAVAQAGSQSNYAFTVSNAGPLTATNITVTDALPTGAVFVSASPGCVFASGVVTCTAASLAANGHLQFSITVRWTLSGPVYDSASVKADQVDTSPASDRTAEFGSLPMPGGDAPLPYWAYVLLGSGLLALAVRRRPPAAQAPVRS